MLGAEYLFGEGLKIYPDDYDLNFQMGFLYAFEMRKFDKAGSYYSKVVNNPKAPVYIKSIVNKLQIHTGKATKESVYISLHEMYLKEKNEVFKNRLYEDMYGLRAEIDLECLNSNMRDTPYS